MSTPTWLDPVIGPTVTFSAADFMAGDGTDESDGMRALFAARAAFDGDAAIYFPVPPVAWGVRSDTPDGAHPQVVSGIPSGTLIYGDGAASLITWAGVLQVGGRPDTQHTGTQKLWRMDSVSRILIRDLTIRGDNSPFTDVFNNQSAAIAFSANAGTSASLDCAVRDCAFDALWGFVNTSRGGGDRRVHTMRCVVTNCANGINANADYSVMYGNRLTDVESIEYAGAPGLIALNDIVRGCLSVGGFNRPDTSKPGTIVVFNSLVQSPPNVAIVTAESYTDGWLQGNVIEAAASDALVIPGLGNPGDFTRDRNTAVENVVLSAHRGLALQSGDGHLIARNRFAGSLLSGVVTTTPTNPVLRENVFSGTFLIEAAGDPTPVIFSGNSFLSGALQADPGTDLLDVPWPVGVEQKLFGDVNEGFATVQVRNWNDAATVDLDLSASGLRPGDIFELYHPGDLLGAPYFTASYDGTVVTVPMRAIDPPDDWAVSTSEALPSLQPTFGAFVLKLAERTATEWAACAAPVASSFARCGPDGVLVDYVVGDALDDATFSRASVATQVGDTGALETVAANVPRAGEFVNGLAHLLIERSRTNLLLNSAAPAPQDVALVAGSYILSVWGIGSCAVSGGAAGTVSEGVPFSFTLAADVTVTFAVVDGLTRWQLESGTFATSFIETAAAAVTRAEDLFDFGHAPKPQVMTGYLRFIERGSVLVSAAGYVLGIANSSAQKPSLSITTVTGGGYRLNYQASAGFSIENAPGAKPLLGDLVELRWMLRADGSVQLGQSINGGDEALSGVGAVPSAGLDPAWSGSSFWLGSFGGNQNGAIAIRAAFIMSGTRSLAELRRLYEAHDGTVWGAR